MDPSDITDAFDDADDLVKSVENGQNGPWNDESAHFEDPKLRDLEDKMSARPEVADYQQRRLRELQERARREGRTAPKAVGSKPQPNGAWPDAGEAAGEWGQPEADSGAAWGDRRKPGGTPPPDGLEGTIVHARRASDRVAPPPEELEAPEDELTPSGAATFVPLMLSAVGVYCLAAATHGFVDGWDALLIARAAGGAALTGFVWNEFGVDRLRAMAIGASIYLAMFLPTSRLGEPQQLFALVFGLLLVVAGSGLFGVPRQKIL